MVQQLIFSTDGQVLVGIGWSRSLVHLWRVSDGYQLPDADQSACDIAFTPDNQWLVLGGGPVSLLHVPDGQVRPFTSTLDPVLNPDGQGRPLHANRALALSSDGQLLVFTDDQIRRATTRGRSTRIRTSTPPRVRRIVGA